MALEDSFLNYSLDKERELKELIKDEPTGDVKTLIKRRGYKRQSLSKTLKALADNPPQTVNDINYFLSKLEDLRPILVGYDNEIELYMLNKDLWDGDTYAEQSEIADTYLDGLRKAVCNLKSEVQNMNTSSNSSPNDSLNSSYNNSNTNKLKLPPVELPHFNGQPEEFERFIHSFETLMSKFDLTQFEKYSYLLQHVAGPARVIIESIPSGNLTYDAAKALLTEAFSDNVGQRFSVIDKICRLKLNSYESAYQWISEAKTLVEQVKRLSIDGSVFCQYFLWSGLSDQFKQQFIAVTNKGKPDLNDILNNSFEVISRMKNSVKISPSSLLSPIKNSLTLATGVKYKSDQSAHDVELQNKSFMKGCSLCCTDNKTDSCDHNLSQCKKYPSNKNKFDRIKELNGCVNCGWLNHSISNCKFKFKSKCKSCNENHFSFLCSKNFSNVRGRVVKDAPRGVVQTNTNNVEFCVMPTSVQCDTVIPTFTLDFPLHNKKVVKARVMYDPASQTTFVSKKFANKFKGNMVRDNFNIKITGFNGSKEYNTKIVRFQTMFGKNERKFDAVIVPELKTKISNPNLNEVKECFMSNNIKLADECLGESDTIDILLGVDYIHNLPVHCCSFGNSPDKMSLLYYTAEGVMLAGNISNLISNLQCTNIVTKLKGFIKSVNEL